MDDDDGGGLLFLFCYIDERRRRKEFDLEKKRKEKSFFYFYDVIISNIFISSPSRLSSTSPCPSVLCVSQCAQLKLSTRAQTAPLSSWMVKVYNEPAL